VNAPLNELARKEAFLMLVTLQDRGCSVDDSREQIASQYGIPISEVPHIEQEGIRRAWPPLNDGP
jgi:hypothetical protein